MVLFRTVHDKNNPYLAINTSEYQIYNRRLAHKLKSINAAIFLSGLINRYEYLTRDDGKEIFTERGKEWFFYTHDKAEERLAMSRKEQDSAILILINHGLIDKMVKGLPGRRCFTINNEETQNQKTQGEE